MSRMSTPSESLSFADVSWLKAVRHNTECSACAGFRKVKWLADAFALTTTTPENCEEGRRLMAAHVANAEAEKNRRTASA